MQLDMERFFSLVPIDSLARDRQQALADQARVEQHAAGTTLFSLGDQGTDSLFLIQGAIELRAEDGQRQTITADSREARHALAHLKPRRYAGRVLSPAAIVRIDSDLLDRMLSVIPADGASAGGVEVEEIDPGLGAADNEWMMSMLQSPAFLRLPASNIQRVFEQLRELPVEAGQVILRQGEPGDYYYLLKQGTAEVLRHSGSREVLLATLNPPQSFGEEALLSNAPRNATVRMQTDGILMRLSRQDFRDQLHKPLLNWVDLEAAGRLVRNGAVRVDVRTESEYQASTLSNALNIPLYLMRLKLAKLDREHRYILFCDTGSRSAAAGFLMSQQGFNVHVLEGGLAASGA